MEYPNPRSEILNIAKKQLPKGVYDYIYFHLNRLDDMEKKYFELIDKFSVLHEIVSNVQRSIHEHPDVL